VSSSLRWLCSEPRVLCRRSVTSRCCRAEALTAWKQAPAARECHPREEHLLPLLVCAGAAGVDTGQVVYSDKLMGVHVASYAFGDWHA
jgi:aromatic ring-opening dioxygenase catalytic subunit (LigB family)